MINRLTDAGGAQDFPISAATQAELAAGLAAAAQTVRPWIISGGSDTGVMKLVGDAMRRPRRALHDIDIDITSHNKTALRDDQMD